ncbi:MAG: hypothetical protein EXR51_02510 [Dehalococcoidia bacterium]|nr:hypothetical protein [Dehalococcoidia bacterium]
MAKSGRQWQNENDQDHLVKPSRIGLGWFVVVLLLVTAFAAGAFGVMTVVGSSMLAVFVYSFGFMAIVALSVRAITSSANFFGMPKKHDFGGLSVPRLRGRSTFHTRPRAHGTGSRGAAETVRQRTVVCAAPS